MLLEKPPQLRRITGAILTLSSRGLHNRFHVLLSGRLHKGWHNYCAFACKINTMSGRGENNKQGSSGRGSSHQSRQAFPDNPTLQKKPANIKTYNILIDEIPYLVTTEPFTYNGEQRYYVSINGSPQHVFTWDSEMRRLAPIDRDASTLPDALEQEISNRLEADL